MIDSFFHAISRWIERLLAWAFIGAVVLNFVNVLGRYCLGQSITGADEVQIYVMVCMAFLGAVTVTWRRMHLRMDVLAQMLPPDARRVLGVCERLIVAGLSCFVLVFSWKYVGQMLMLDRRSDNAGIPMWIPHGAVALGFTLIALISLWRLALLLAGDPAERAADLPAPAGADAS